MDRVPQEAFVALNEVSGTGGEEIARVPMDVHLSGTGQKKKSLALQCAVFLFAVFFLPPFNHFLAPAALLGVVVLLSLYGLKGSDIRWWT